MATLPRNGHVKKSIADKPHISPAALEFVGAFFDADKPVAAICHGPWIVLEAGEARSRSMTSRPLLKTDLRNGGATWVDEEVPVDGNQVTSRKPGDIRAFNHYFEKLSGIPDEKARDK
jgi:protease I